MGIRTPQKNQRITLVKISLSQENILSKFKQLEQVTIYLFHAKSMEFSLFVSPLRYKTSGVMTENWHLNTFFKNLYTFKSLLQVIVSP